MLASLFGSSETELSRVEFLPGEARIEESSRARLDTLARVLHDHPGLGLVINWRPMENVDREVLKEKRLKQLIQQERELLAGGATATQDAGVSEAEAIRSLVRRRFPDAVPELAREPSGPDPIATAPQSSRKPWFSRLFQSIFGGGDVAGQSAEEAAGASAAPAAVPEPAIAELRKRLLGSLTMTPSDYVELARARARAAREYLLAARVDPHRVDIADAPAPEEEPKTAAADRALIFFELREASPPPDAPATG